MERPELFRVALGSHNVRSLAHGIALAQALGLPDRSYEIQMLYGMGEPIKEVLVSLGRRVRVYTPYGQLLPGMAYLVRRLLENTANESFLRQLHGARPGGATADESAREKDKGRRTKDKSEWPSFVLCPLSFVLEK